MTPINRLKLWAGVLAVLMVMGLLTLLFNQRLASVSSLSATVAAPTSAVGSAYGGVVTDQLVQEGQRVRAGDRLFVVSSSTLQQDVARGARPASNIAYDLDTTRGVVTYKAVTDGYVSELGAFRGTFVNDGAPLATIVDDSARSVVATYRLAPVDYGRIVLGGRAAVVLPDGTKLDGSVAGVSVEQEDGQAVTNVTITSPGLDAESLGLLANRGTPVVAIMSLRDDGPLAGPTQAMLAFLTKIGVR